MEQVAAKEADLPGQAGGPVFSSSLGCTGAVHPVPVEGKVETIQHFPMNQSY